MACYEAPKQTRAKSTPPASVAVCLEDAEASRKHTRRGEPRQALGTSLRLSGREGGVDVHAIQMR
jgi:hypothetical protein